VPDVNKGAYEKAMGIFPEKMDIDFDSQGQAGASALDSSPHTFLKNINSERRE
jgi:hypothetical protein